MSKRKATAEELPFALQLSRDEIVVLIRFHSSQAKRIAKAYGTAAMKLQAQRPFGCARDLKALGDLAKDHMQAHTTRAKGLISILPPV